MSNRSVYFAAAENGALPGGKVGGVGDVVRDLPKALTELGLNVSVVTPAYGRFHKLPEARFLRAIEVEFFGSVQKAEVYAIKLPASAVNHILIQHQLFSPFGDGQIYSEDPPERPFATDATKFAFFSGALAEYLLATDHPIDILHLHDWHTGFYLALRQLDSKFAALKKITTVYSIHNLAYQGIRPWQGDASSWNSWFPHLHESNENSNLEKFSDPRYPDCINPMATAIRCADRLATVSPTYAKEIQRSSDGEAGFSGGEGLEGDLQQRGNIVGILNGCEYADQAITPLGWQSFVDLILDNKALKLPARSRQTLLRRKKRPFHLLTSVGRISTQKMALFLYNSDGQQCALQQILQSLPRNALFLLLGSGEKAYEEQLYEIAESHSKLVFVNGFSEAVADQLYAGGDLFLMPSSFEPCGISQMLAMRAAQPCVVHAVGGLRDTVVDNVDGFHFSGNNLRAQSNAFAGRVSEAMNLRRNNKNGWSAVCQQARDARFSWQNAARAYIENLYRLEQ